MKRSCADNTIPKSGLRFSDRDKVHKRTYSLSRGACRILATCHWPPPQGRGQGETSTGGKEARCRFSAFPKRPSTIPRSTSRKSSDASKRVTSRRLLGARPDQPLSLSPRRHRNLFLLRGRRRDAHAW